MAFESVITQRPLQDGNKRISRGTFASSGSGTGGDITTGLHSCEFIILQQKGSAVVADAPVVNEDLPLNGGVVTIVTTADAVGYWRAEGV